MGLMGDSSDNIPGVPGIGEKTAKELASQYGTIENLLAHVQEIKKPKLRESLLEFAHLARMSRDLAILRSDVPLDMDYEKLKIKPPDNAALLALLKELEFTTLLKYAAPEPGEAGKYRTVLDEAAFNEMLRELSSAEEISIDTETTSLDPMRAELVGMSFSVQPQHGWYLPLGHDYIGVPRQLSRDYALPRLKAVLEDPRIKKIGQNVKYDMLVLRRHGIVVQGVAFDTMIASYLLNPGKPSHSLDSIALEYLNYKTITYEEVTGTGKKQIGFSEIDVDIAARYSGEDADIALRLKHKLAPLLLEHDLDRLFREIEMALMSVLAEMERVGVKIDAGFLGAMSVKLAAEIAALERDIYE